MTIDYQEIVEIMATIIGVAVPIGILFSLGEWCVKFFVDCALGRWRKNG